MSCLAALGQLIYCWWQVDRIRVPRATGRLFQLNCGTRLLIRHEVYVVVHVTRLEELGRGDDCIFRGMRYRLAPTQLSQLSWGCGDDASRSTPPRPTFHFEVLMSDTLGQASKLQLLAASEKFVLFEDDVCVLDTKA